MAQPKSLQTSLEVQFFRGLNRVVEPMVRAGFGPKSLPLPIQKVVRVLAPYTRSGWAFAVLSPGDDAGRCRARKRSVSGRSAAP